MRKVTIEDISRHTGLSRGTVSRALNDRPDISEQTKQRVLEACNQLRYVPSHAARSLATGRRYAVAILVDDLRSTYAASFLRGAINRARRDRYAVLVSELGTEHEAALDHLRTLLSERVDCLLLAANLPTNAAERMFENLAERPIVSAEPIPQLQADVLAPDYVEAGRLAARHMLDRAGREIAYVHEPGSQGADQRRAGFEEACRGAGLDPGQVIINLPAREHGADRLGTLRGRFQHLRGVAASTDFLALSLMMSACEVGRIAGRQLAVMGQGNELAGALVSPTLTTIDFSGEEIGQRAMELALQRVSKARQDAPQQTLVPPVLVERESTRLA